MLTRVAVQLHRGGNFSSHAVRPIDVAYKSYFCASNVKRGQTLEAGANPVASLSVCPRGLNTADYYYYYYNHLTASSRTAWVSRYQKGKNQSGFYWSKRQ